MKRIGWILACALVLLLMPVTVWAQSGQNVVISNERVLEPGERVSEDMAVFGGMLRALEDSEIDGNLVVFGGEVDLAGLVTGDVVAFGGTVQLGPTAEVRGDVVVLGTLRRHPDAEVHGNVVEGLEATSRLDDLPRPWLQTPTPPQNPNVRPEGVSWVLKTLRAIVLIVGLGLIAAVIASVVPDNLVNSSQSMRSTILLSLGMGVLTIILAMVLIGLLTIICIGIPVAIVLALALLAASILAWVSAGRLVGQALLIAINHPNPTLLAEAVVGTLLITVISQVPCLGAMCGTLLLSWGLGAVILTRLGTTPDPLWSPFATTTQGASSTTPPTSPPPLSPLVDSCAPNGVGEGEHRDTRPLGDIPGEG